MTVAANVERVAGHFAADGLALADYLGAAVRLPQPFCLRPATVIGNVEGSVRPFAAAMQ